MAATVATAPAPQLDALFLPIASGELRLPDDGRVLFLRAREGASLRAFAGPGWLCAQSFRPFADELCRAGMTVGEPAQDDRFALVLVLPPRQRDEARALLARAARHLQSGGVVLVAVPNAEGAKSAEADAVQLFGAVHSLSKHKCRVFWAGAGDAMDTARLAEWEAFDAPRRIAGGYLSRSGLFAWDRIDTASALLAAQLPHDLVGRVADLGAGYGYLAAQVIARCPGVTAVDLYEAEARALEPARVNLAEAIAASGRKMDADVRWHDVTTGLPHRYDAIVTNPPFHQGRADLPGLGRAFIDVAADALLPHGRLWMVANRHLPYEATLAARFAHVRTVAMQEGFKVIEAVRA
ncbi:class I SAM-dependent methyltransferase [Frateuria sp. GZRe12]|uniref:class I SAM-dependent methyltransferase n=1 Tax=Frateuria sp. GZRe12 TaxID=3351533 RepID=UPI003EDCAA3C